MRNFMTLTLVSITVLSTAVPAFSQWENITVSEWAASPITIGDKMYTLISTTWVGTSRFWYQNGSPGVYDTNLDPWTDRSIFHETRTLVFKVTIVDDPATPQNDSLLYHITRVAGSCNCDPTDTFTYTSTFDDNSDFSSPLWTFTNGGEVTVSPPLPGFIKELYVSLIWDASMGGVNVTASITEFVQAEGTVPSESTTWGSIKALFDGTGY